MNNDSFNHQARNFLQDRVWLTEQHPYLIKQILSRGGLQQTFTPIELCKDMLTKLAEYTSLHDAEILVLFNLEIVDTLIQVFGVEASRITFFADYEDEGEAARHWYNVDCPTDIITYDTKRKEICMPDIKKKFDVVVMNPPYQPPVKDSKSVKARRGSGHVIYPDFVKLAMSILDDGAHLCAVHPPKWRKPDDEMYAYFLQHNLLHLEMHSKKDGIKTFGAMTPYDWYIMQNKDYDGLTTIKTFDNQKMQIDLRKFPFLPHNNLQSVLRLIANDKQPKCDVIFSRSAYGADKKHMSEVKTEKYKYPCVHSTGINGVRYMYSSVRGQFFDVPKVIFGDNGGDTGICNAIVDADGEYGLTQHAIGIPIESKKDGEQMKSAIESSGFKAIVNACQYGGFQIDWRMFRHFRKDFWKDFI